MPFPILMSSSIEDPHLHHKTPSRACILAPAKTLENIHLITHIRGNRAQTGCVTKLTHALRSLGYMTNQHVRNSTPGPAGNSRPPDLARVIISRDPLTFRLSTGGRVSYDVEVIPDYALQKVRHSMPSPADNRRNTPKVGRWWPQIEV